MLVVIGCGNPVRSDDGAGIEVVRRLAAADDIDRDRVTLVDAGTSGMEVMFRVRDARRVVIVDACSSGGEPGAVYRLPAREAATPTEHGYSLHGLRWDHALHAGRRMHGEGFLDHADVFLIEVACLDYGLELSAAASRGVARVVDEIARMVAAP